MAERIHTYDNLEVGDSCVRLRQITFEEVLQFAELSGDDNPIHVNRAYAEQTSYGGPIAHGAFLIGIASKILGRNFPGPGTVGVSQDAHFIHQVPADSALEIEVTVVEKIERYRQVKLRVDIHADGELAVHIIAVAVPPKAPG